MKSPQGCETPCYFESEATVSPNYPISKPLHQSYGYTVCLKLVWGLRNYYTRSVTLRVATVIGTFAVLPFTQFDLQIEKDSTE